MAERILIADDQADVVEALRLLLKNEGFAIETAASPAAVYRAVSARSEFDSAAATVDRAEEFRKFIAEGWAS